MKRLIPLCLSLLVFTQTSAFAADKVMYSCEDIYALQITNKIERRDNYNKSFNDPSIKGGLSNNSRIAVASLIVGVATVSAPVVVVGVLTPQVISIIKNLPSREERIQKLQEESSASFKRYIKRLKRDISEDVTPEEVSEIIQAGFDSGLYCQDLPKVYSPRQIRKHVRELMAEKYGKVEK